MDQVNAFSTGGAHGEGNLTAVCNKCNVRKSAAPLDKWDKRSKRKAIGSKYGEPQHWNGLTTVFVALAERDPDAFTIGERTWLKAIKLHGQFVPAAS